MIIPKTYEHRPGTGRFVLEDGMAVAVDSSELSDVAEGFANELWADTGIRLRVTVDPSLSAALRVRLGDLGLDDLPRSRGGRADGLVSADERHGLQVADDGVVVWGPGPEAVYRGLTSLRQLAAATLTEGAAHIPTLSIRDVPDYSWRGLALDVARTFHDVDTVKRVIDMLALYKFNVLHLHLTDDQGWRFDVPGWPQLLTVGAAGAAEGRPGGFYTRADIAELVEYAANRFVTVVPEVDMPGHSAAAIRSYPELGPAPEGHSGAVYLDPAADRTWLFVEDAVAVLADQFKTSAFIHIGGDEAFGMRAEDHIAFLERAAAIVREQGKDVIGWQEMARAELSSRETVQYWMSLTELDEMLGSQRLEELIPPEFVDVVRENLERGRTDLQRALAMGANIIASPTSRFYLDRPFAESALDPSHEHARSRLGMSAYTPTSVEDGVNWDIEDELPGVDLDAQLVGFEGAVWCETVTGREDLELLLLPRLAGVGERSWRALARPDWPDYRQRLATHSRVWNARGWNWFTASSIPWIDAPGSS
ncbi:family 20 glycosylhydrolase [Nocardia sp. NPDC059091]|uniref:family 20 glycosylhydrolase n=1 Tax=Nocardia sp. NPDC059091 TaxID=3346724 RepID=UPI003689C704